MTRTRGGALAWAWRGVGLGQLLGFPVRLDLSWFAGLAVLVLLSRQLWAPAVAGLAAVGLSAVFAVAFFGCVLVHELAHALVARAVGVPTAEIRLFVFGGVARIAGEPADPGAEVLVAVAGPLVSVVLAGLLDLACWTVAGPTGDLLALLFLGNLVVAGFNLLPGFPLDGGRVARALVWRLTGRRLLATRSPPSWAGPWPPPWSSAGPPPCGSRPPAGCPRWCWGCSCGRRPAKANAPPPAPPTSPPAEGPAGDPPEEVSRVVLGRAVPLTLFGALTLAGGSSGRPAVAAQPIRRAALAAVALARPPRAGQRRLGVRVRPGRRGRVFPGRLAAAVLVAGVGLLAVAVAVRRRGRISRGD